MREFLRRLFGRPAPVPEGTPAATAPRKSLLKRISSRVLQRAAEAAQAPTAPRATLKWPELPPGVIPAQQPPHNAYDGESPAILARDDLSCNWGFLNQSGLGWGVGFQGYPFLAELTQISEYRSPSETISTEMTRKWIKFKTIGKATVDGEDGDSQDKIERLEQAFKDFKVQDLFRKAVLLDGEFGRAQIMISIKGHDEKQDLPLIIGPKTIGVDALENLSVVEPYWTTPYSYNTTDPTKPDFYKPRSWYVIGRKWHSSRILTFIAREVPDLLKPAYNFGGISMTQLMEPYVNQWLRTRNSVSDLIHSFSTSVLATDMQATLSDGGDGTSLLARAQLFNNMRDNKGLMLVDKASEELIQVNTPLSGLDALQAQSQEHMCAPSHIPIVKLFGMTPSGLNNSTEDEITVFYDYIRAMQELLFSPHLDRLLKIFQLHLFGAVDDSISYEYVPLTEQTMKELSEIRKSDADAGVAYINSGVVSPDEERERLQSDPNSGYTDLEGDAPEPPVDPNVIDPETGKPHEPAVDPDEDDAPAKPGVAVAA